MSRLELYIVPFGSFCENFTRFGKFSLVSEQLVAAACVIA